MYRECKESIQTVNFALISEYMNIYQVEINHSAQCNLQCKVGNMNDMEYGIW